MPWNCLCSSKDKRRPEISAPILKLDDHDNETISNSAVWRSFDC
ncbi:hypothetical protein Bhyg_12876 [Pseudolycoriella hygida]|uniref:Uncharacterized protein n=1 Tax=Pseudolycoriella hygida TaxID=35572 RepID=A0A9Q0S0T5_9DIPT|nr:hypothetical protein Bhyg_12876 [Pseudolycoriella hygida]